MTADAQSFSRAAAALNVKQSTLSRRVAGLEHRLGIKLFERSTRGAIPTEQGKAFLSVARRIVTDVDNLQTTARAVSYGEEGRIAMGFSASLMTGNMRATIADFMGRHPDIQFDATEAEPDKLLSDLNARIVDAVIVPSDIADAGISRRSAWSERLLVALPKDHEFLKLERIHWSDLRREVFVVPRQGVGSALASLLVRRLTDQGYRANIIMQDTSIESVLSTVSIGRYITIATEASLGVTWPDLEFREIYDQNWPARLDYALYWRDDNDNPALKRFFKLINERYPA
jgi:DNA-binding transcriptional LysR family regulator